MGVTGRWIHNDEGKLERFSDPAATTSALRIFWNRRNKNGLGYITISCPNHPRTWASRGAVTEHTLLMELGMGRFLAKDECVHHIDGNRSNNAVENLKVMKKSDHAHLHHKRENDPPCMCCGEATLRRLKREGKFLCWKCYLSTRYASGQDKGRKVACVTCGKMRGYKRLVDGVCGHCRLNSLTGSK